METIKLSKPVQYVTGKPYIELLDGTLFEVLTEEVGDFDIEDPTLILYPYRHVNSGIIIFPGQENSDLSSSRNMTKLAALAAANRIEEYSKMITVCQPPSPTMEERAKEQRALVDEFAVA